MRFFDDPEDWPYVLDPDSFGILNAMIAHYDEGYTNGIVVELINNKLYSVINHRKLPYVWGCVDIEYSVDIISTFQHPSPIRYYTTQPLFEMFKKESGL